MCKPVGGDGQPNLGVDSDGRRAVFPFPPNGVLYAEGNVRVRGVMPKQRNARADMKYFEDDYNPTGNWGRTRRYDLQVVSGGTIYIEGDLLSPVSAGLYFPDLGTTPVRTAILRWDQLKGSRVALLARDSVCLNTTALHPRPRNLYVRGPQGQWVADTFNDGQPNYPDSPQGAPLAMFFQGPTDETTNQPSSAQDGPLAGGDYPTSPKSIDFHYQNVRLGLAPLRGRSEPEQSAVAARPLRLVHQGRHNYRRDPDASAPARRGGSGAGIRRADQRVCCRRGNGLARRQAGVGIPGDRHARSDPVHLQPLVSREPVVPGPGRGAEPL